MEQGSFLPFSSMIASILLYERKISGVDVVNFINLLSQENIFISDEADEEMDSLMMCVNCYNYDYFEIRDNLDYDSYLFEGVTLKEFLYSKSSLAVLEFINRRGYFKKKDSVEQKQVNVVRVKKRVKILSHIFNFLG